MASLGLPHTAAECVQDAINLFVYLLVKQAKVTDVLGDRINSFKCSSNYRGEKSRLRRYLKCPFIARCVQAAITLVACAPTRLPTASSLTSPVSWNAACTQEIATYATIKQVEEFSQTCGTCCVASPKR